MQSENLDLRDRIEVLESIIKQNPTDYENYDWRKLLEEEELLPQAEHIPVPETEQNKVNFDFIIKMITTFKKDNRVLNQKVVHLEVQNQNLQQHGGMPATMYEQYGLNQSP